MRFNVSGSRGGGSIVVEWNPPENARRADALPLAVGVIQVDWRGDTLQDVRFSSAP
jgi:hypothetical protein